MDDKKSPWNSLEIAKLVVSILTPLVVGAVGYWIQTTIAEQGQAWKSSEQLVERRLAIYDEIRLKLNRIYCFIEDIGTWKSDTPESISTYRREVHAIMHSNRAFWSPDTFAAYLDYMDHVAFKTYTGVGQDASIRTTKYQKEQGIVGWKQEWSGRLTNEKAPNHEAKYSRLQELISRDLRLSGSK